LAERVEHRGRELPHLVQEELATVYNGALRYLE
jgi:hypothetical protein